MAALFKAVSVSIRRWLQPPEKIGTGRAAAMQVRVGGKQHTLPFVNDSDQKFKPVCGYFIWIPK